MTPETASVLVAAIAAAGSAGVAIITTRQHRSTRDALQTNTSKTEQVLHQVQNDHGSNLRDDLDEMHSKLERVEAAQGYLGGTVGHLIRDVKTALRHQAEHDTAAALTVEQLRKRDDQLEQLVRDHIADEGCQE